MKPLIAIALCLAILLSGAYAKDDCPEFKGSDSIIYHKCKKDYAENYTMLKYCLDSQHEALADLKKKYCNGIKDEEHL